MRILLDGQTFSTPEATRGIGVATRMVVEHAARHDPTKEWFVSVRDGTDLEVFSPDIRGRLTPIILSDCMDVGDFRTATRRYTSLLQAAVDDHGIAAYWNPNPLMTNVLLAGRLSNVTTFATVHDLIPWVMRDLYLDRWPPHLQREYQRRLKALPKLVDHLWFPSESSREDYIGFDRDVADKSSVVYWAADHHRFTPINSSRIRHRDPLVLYTGGFDPRKNMEGALEAFAILVQDDPHTFERLKLCIICSVSPEELAPFEQRARALGIDDRLVMPGYVTDAQLADLYQRARVFFFPSMYEGFGLPVLEAMSCGTPVVVSNVSSLPEVAGEHAYFCSPDEPADMANSLRRALTDPDIDNRCLAALKYAQQFTWAKTAAEYSRIFTNVHINQTAKTDRRRLRVAYVTPWPPHRSGIAHYAQVLASYLSEYIDMTLYVENVNEVDPPLFGMPVCSLTDLPTEAEAYDTILYHIGNNTQFHRAIYQLAWEIPGVLVLHDYNINPFLSDAFLGTEQEDLYYTAALEAYGIARDSIPPHGLDTFDFPMSVALAKRSHVTIVHSAWVRDQLNDANQVHVVPHGSMDGPGEDIRVALEPLRARLGIDPSEFVISTLGFVHRLKRVDVALNAIKKLVDQGLPIRFVIGGAIVDPTLGIEEKIKELGLESCVTMCGYLSEEDLEGVVALSDVVINLRCPSLGEASGTLMRAFAHGKPCVVSNYELYAELPNDICWKVDVDELEVPQLVAYLERLLRDPAVRRQLGRNAKEYVDRYTSFDFAARLYAQALASAGRPELQHDPEEIANQLRFDRDWDEVAPALGAEVEHPITAIASLPPSPPRRPLPIQIAKWVLRPTWRLVRRGLQPFVIRFDAHLARLFDNLLHERIDQRVATLPHLTAVRDELVKYVGTLNGNLNSVQSRLTSSALTRDIDDRLAEATRDISRLRHQIETLRDAVEMQTSPPEPIPRGSRRRDRIYRSRGRRGTRNAA